MKVFSNLFVSTERDLSLFIDEEWSGMGLNNRTFIKNIHGDIYVDGTHLDGVDGEIGLNEFGNRVDQIRKSKGEVGAMISYLSKSMTAGKIGEELQGSLDYRRRIDAREIARKKDVFKELSQLEAKLI